MSAIMDIWNEIAGIAASTDVVMLAIAVLIIVGTGLLMQSAGALGTATLAALVVFALANYAKGVVMGANAVAGAETDWQKLMAMDAGMMIAYFISFAVLIAFAFIARAMIFSR